MKRRVGIQKFNGGDGALLCPQCRLIVAAGFRHPATVFVCSGCGTRFHSPQYEHGPTEPNQKPISGGEIEDMK